MYKVSRNIHLVLSLLVTPFLFIYAVSALIYSFPFLNDKTVETSVNTFQMTAMPRDVEDILIVLRNEYGIRGDLEKSVVKGDEKVKLRISRPGTYYEVLIDPQLQMLTIKENFQSVETFLKALHHSSGFESSSVAQKWWGIVVILVAAMIVGIVVTGIILWSYNRKDRKSGLIFMGSSFFFCTVVLAVLRFS